MVSPCVGLSLSYVYQENLDEVIPGTLPSGTVAGSVTALSAFVFSPIPS